MFPSKFEKEHRVKELDYRIHFALNCGAKSCPPINFYKPETINQQLEIATKSYLTGEVIYHEENNIAELPAVIGWFRQDFGGKAKIIALLQELGMVPKYKKPTLKFQFYDWSLYLENYKS